MMKIVAALAVATTVQTVSAGFHIEKSFAENTSTWPKIRTIKVKNEDRREPSYDGAFVDVDGVYHGGNESSFIMKCDKDNVPNTSGNHDCTQPKFIREVVEGDWLLRADAATCTSTTGFDYVGDALLQDPETTDKVFNNETLILNGKTHLPGRILVYPTVEGNDYMIVNMYGAGNNYCRYLCQETERCMFYTIGNNRCYLKGAGAKKKAGKKNAKKEGGSCIPDPDAPDPTVTPETDAREDPCNAIKCGKQCKGRLFTYPNLEDFYADNDSQGTGSDGRRYTNLNKAVPHDCGWSKSANACVTGSHTGPNEKKLESQAGACTEAPTTPATTCKCAKSKGPNECWLKADESAVGSNYCIRGDGSTPDSTWTWSNCVFEGKMLLRNCPVTEAPELATPAPRNCRKQCAGKFDKLKRGKGKQSLARVCGLKNCNQCVECTRPPMVNYTLYQGSSEDATNCPSGCDDVESEADVYGNTTWSCLVNNSGTAKSLGRFFGPQPTEENNSDKICAPMYYPDSDGGGCPYGCAAYSPEDGLAEFEGHEVCVVAELAGGKVRQTRQLRMFGTNDMEWVPTLPAKLCTGPLDFGRMCKPTSMMPMFGTTISLDFTTKVIKTIKKKGFWETHCQLACYDRENCGAYVYTKGTCKLFRTLPIDEATMEQFDTALQDVKYPSLGVNSWGRLLKIIGLKHNGFFQDFPIRQLGMPSWLNFRETGMCLTTKQYITLFGGM